MSTMTVQAIQELWFLLWVRREDFEHGKTLTLASGWSINPREQVWK